MILACAQDDLRKRRKRWIVWILALVVIGAATILNFSRSGIAILLAGSAFWLGALAFRQRSPWRLALGISLLLLLLLLTALLLFGGQTFERFHLRNFITADASTNFRWRIFHDTFRLIRNSPWCGIGFGNFESIFAIFRDASLGDPRALHPESDWLWLWTELGCLSVVLTIVAIAMFVSRVFPLRVGTNQGYRLAALIAALLFAIHGIVDVSGHQVGTAFAANIFAWALTVSAALFEEKSVDVDLISLCWIGITCGGPVIGCRRAWCKLSSRSVGISSAKQLSEVANREGNYSETIALTTRALRWAPIDWQLYLARAIGEVDSNRRQTQLMISARRAFWSRSLMKCP